MFDLCLIEKEKGVKIDKLQFKLFLKFLKYLSPYSRRQVIVLILSVIGVLLSLANPYLSKLVVDRAIINRDLNTFIILGIVGMGVFVLSGIITATESFLKKGIRLRLTFDLNKKAFSHLQHLPLDFFRDKSTGEWMFKLNYDIERVVDFIVSVPDDFIGIFPRLLFILAVIFYLNWQMALFAVVLVPILYLPVYFLSRRMRKILWEMLNNSQNIFMRLQEVFSHIYLVKALGRERAEIRRNLRDLIANIKINLKSARLEIVSNFVNGSFYRVIIGLVTIFGGFQVIRGGLTPGTFTAIMIYLSQLIGLQTTITFFFQRLISGLVSCKRLDEILEQKPKAGVFSPQARRIIFKRPHIEFKKVTFGYNHQELVLKDLDFTIQKRFTALVGPSGCGKTTIINLILRLYQPCAGGISIDGYNIRDLDSSSLRDQIGVALQEPFLWNDTVENNIKYADPKTPRQYLHKLSQLAGVEEFVGGLSKGYQTVIGENACKLSDGQKQKIALARALIKGPKILILDEAMSSMDSASEERIISQIKQNLEIPITIIVSHRLSTVMMADLVYFLKDSSTLLIGQPQELLDKNQMFYNLFAAQIRNPALTPIFNYGF